LSRRFTVAQLGQIFWDASIGQLAVTNNPTGVQELVWDVDDGDPAYVYQPPNEWGINPANVSQYSNGTGQCVLSVLSRV
jgi:hypothetical protein